MTETVNLKAEDSTAADSELLRRTAQADVTAFAELYDLYSRPLYSLVFRMLNDCHGAQDVLQKAFFKIWQKAGSFDAKQSNLFSWLAAIAHNEAVDHLRRQRRQGLIFQEHPDDVTRAEAIDTCLSGDSFGQDEAVRLRAVVNNLPTEQRQAIELAFFTGLTGQEIATRLGEPLGTVKSRIRRGMLGLRDHLEATPEQISVLKV